ncbi:MAG: VPLPA-CTERM sorting domain-containing protein [Pseudomonadota bacterium]|nr:VPLPA-CTERM sorting domain-containing protein [Pseudomonadota bacterium]
MVNSEAFFGFSDWTFVAKDNDVNGVDEGINLYGLLFTGGNLSGTWSLSSFPPNLDFMLVFKAGSNNGKTVPGNLVAYLLNASSGSYQSPTLKDSDFSARAISHISLYVRDNGFSEVPLPAAAWLMLAGLGGLGFASRKKKAA